MLDLDWLDAQVGRAVAEYLAARWRERERTVRRGPPLPAVLSDARSYAWLERGRHASRRAELLWRWHATARVEGDPAVAAAWRARDGAALVAARHAAVGGDYLAHVRERDELPVDIRSDACTPQAAAPAPEPTVDAVLERFADAGLRLDGVRLDVAVTSSVDAPVAACTFPVDPPHDVRVFVRAPATARGLRLLAHELGHAAYAAGHDPALPWSLRTAPSRAVHEAVAAVAERLVGGPHPDAVARQRALADAEARAYAGRGALSDTMMDDPGAQASYLYAHVLADRIAPSIARLSEHVFRIGASVTVAELLDAL